ncbi:MAG: hypothetical protein IIB40_10855 [Candidatus Marinimicrobia bacterium]|nr:hypothetical protein [Candidatus Neomarinimicrobiota bacterium]
MTDQLNIYEFGTAMDELRVESGRLANRADELHRIEWEDLSHSWDKALCSPEQLRVALITKALGIFDVAMDSVDEELRSTKTALKLVIDKLPELNEKKS